MSSPRHHLTPALEQSMVAYTRAGGYPHVAAEAAGVPRQVFDQWRQEGEGPRPAAGFRSFAGAIRQAAAQARLAAEVKIHEEKPLDWLRSGPGRESGDAPGWTGPVRPRLATSHDSPLLDAQVQGLVTTVLEALDDFPDARAVTARRLVNSDPAASQN
jgi:hypothetical protein